MNEYIEHIKSRYFSHGEQRRACVVTFGCQQNEADSEKLRGMAAAMGYTVTDDPKNADLIVVNTCAVREHAEQRALSIVGQYKHLKAKNPSLVIGVCGCMAAQAHRAAELKNSYPYVSFSFPPSALEDFPAILSEVLDSGKRRFYPEADAPKIGEGVPVLRSSPFKSWVSIMYGCNNFCSYCIVPYVRGRERSREYPCIVEEVRGLIADGQKEITLLGQNVNSFKGGCTFAELVERIDEIDGDYILRFMTSHPKDVSDELIAAMAKSRHMARHFHLPLQSGSDRVLKAMNRHYDKAHYLSAVEKLRAAMPKIALTTDIIVGFPGETEEEFAETLALLDSVRFDMIYSFIYSPRVGTPAATMQEQVPEAVKSERMQRLLALQNQISLEKNQAEVGNVLRVLCEGASKSDPDTMTGRADSNKLVHFKADPNSVGQFVSVRITRAEPFNLQGEIVKE